MFGSSKLALNCHVCAVLVKLVTLRSNWHKPIQPLLFNEALSKLIPESAAAAKSIRPAPTSCGVACPSPSLLVTSALAEVITTDLICVFVQLGFSARNNAAAPAT